MLVPYEYVDGTPQGAAIKFPLEFPTGTMRGRFHSGDGQLYITVGDLLLWHRSFEQRRIGAASFNKVMLTRGTLDSGETIDYAFGLSHGIRHGRPTVSHGLI